MTTEPNKLPTPLHPRVAAVIAKAQAPIDYQLLADGAGKLVQDNLDAETLAMRKLASETVLLLGPHIRPERPNSAWKDHQIDTH